MSSFFVVIIPFKCKLHVTLLKSSLSHFTVYRLKLADALFAVRWIAFLVGWVKRSAPNKSWR